MVEISSASVARLNDMLRVQGIGGRVLATPGVRNLDHDIRAKVLIAIRDFKDFSADNDPHGEHDFGSVKVDGDEFFFKIDYYDISYEYLSPNSADPNVTRRVMTIMRADEY